MIDLFVPGRLGGRGALTGKAYVEESGFAQAAGPFGMAADDASSSSIIIADDADDVLSTTECTIILAKSLYGALTNAGAGIGYGTAASDRVNAHLPFGNGNIYWDFGNATEGSGRVSVSGQTWPLHQLEVFALVAGANRGREIWRNGVMIASNASATAARSTTTNALECGPYNGALYQHTYLAGILNYAVDRAALAEITANPWQLLKSAPRRMYFDLGAGGGVNAVAIGGFSVVSVVAPAASASATADASAAGAFSSTSVTAPSAQATSGTAAAASGGFVAALAIPASASASATQDGAATGAFAGVSAGSPAASAIGTSNGTAIGGFVAISTSAPAALASTSGDAGGAGSFAPVSVAPAAGAASATANAAAAGGFVAAAVVAPGAVASSGQDVGASGGFAAVAVAPPSAQATVAALASGGFASVSVAAVGGYGTATSPNAVASGGFAPIVVSPPRAVAAGSNDGTATPFDADAYLAAYLNPPVGRATHGHDYLRIGERIARRRGIL